MPVLDGTRASVADFDFKSDDPFARLPPYRRELHAQDVVLVEYSTTAHENHNEAYHLRLNILRLILLHNKSCS